MMPMSSVASRMVWRLLNAVLSYSDRWCTFRCVMWYSSWMSVSKTVSLFFIVVRFCRLRVVMRGWSASTGPLRQNMQRKAGTPVPE